VYVFLPLEIGSVLNPAILNLFSPSWLKIHGITKKNGCEKLSDLKSGLQSSLRCDVHNR